MRRRSRSSLRTWWLVAATLATACHEDSAAVDRVRLTRAAVNGAGEQREGLWLNASPPEAERRSGRALVYHAASKRLLMVDLGHIWHWNGRQWFEVPEGAGGPPVFDAAVYHPERRSIVTYGGSDGQRIHDQTWEWDGTRWSNRTLESAKPPPLWGTALAWDGHGGRVVMFGGYENPDYPFRATAATMWEWNATTGGWTSVEPSSPLRPSQRGLHQMVWDPTRKLLVLFGTAPMDVWEWESGSMTWTQRPLPADRSVERQSYRAVYDVDRKLTVLVGGVGATAERFALEWNAVDGKFVDVVSGDKAGPPARILPSAAYDSGRHRLVVTGGLTADWLGGFNDVWEMADSPALSADAAAGAVSPADAGPVSATDAGPGDAGAPPPAPDSAPASTADAAANTLPAPGPMSGPRPPAGTAPASEPTKAADARPGAYAGCTAGGAGRAGAGATAAALLAALLVLGVRRRRR